MRVLIIEDDEKTARALASGLEGSGFSTATAHTGEEGFFLLNEQAPDTAAILQLIQHHEDLAAQQTIHP